MYYRIAGNFRVMQIFRGQSSQRENLNLEKLPRTGISHAKLVVGVVSWHRNANINSSEALENVHPPKFPAIKLRDNH